LPDAPAHLIELIHREAAILEQKSSRLGGFDAKGFRRDMLQYLEEIQSSREADNLIRRVWVGSCRRRG
jgi:hypothetical protein